ncbi:MAG: hypothetical protein C0625_02190 [Arcobacter sp.]|nr:MAG: hypothetical protein C0625_02190 [Arcobacter sp.]
MGDLVEVALEIEPFSGKMLTIVEKGISFFEKKRNERINTFYEELYQGTTEEERIKYEQQIEVNADDFYGLLNASIEDEEEEKVNIYVNLFKSIRDTDLFKDKKARYQAIHIAKNLPFSALELIRLSEIESKKARENGGRGQEGAEFFIHKMRGFSMMYELNMLEQYTVIYIDQKTNRYKINPISSLFVNSFFTPEELSES